MKKIFYLVILVGLLSYSCKKTEETNEYKISSDSLSIQIDRMIQEKKLYLELKSDFEKSRYGKSLLKYKSVIKKYSKRYGFDWRLIVAQIMQESRFRESALSPVGASGLMQLMPTTAKEISRELDVQYILKNPRENIAAGIYHLKKQYQYFPNADFNNRTKLTLASYNCGIGRIIDAQDISRFYNHSPIKWRYIRNYLTQLKSSDWELHLQVWPLGKPTYGYFYGYDETLTYVDAIWELYQVYKKIL